MTKEKLGAENMNDLTPYQLVRTLRKAKGWTLRELHERTLDENGRNGIAVEDLCRIENGKMHIGPGRAFKLGAVFKRHPKCFVTRF
jgi:transcriptional regulator with XRE-family HTH domain